MDEEALFTDHQGHSNGSTLEDVMRVIVKKWGNSASVRFPSGIMEAAHLSLNDAVDVRVEDDRIVIEPIRSSEYLIADLLARITAQNIHDEVGFGEPVGKKRL
jgi:antitoxin MazE